MELSVLGPLTVVHDGRTQEFAGARPRELLALLATRPNQPVSPQRLIDELWDDAPPATAASALRVHVGRIRTVLEQRKGRGGGERLPLGPGGYVLRVDASELDALRFEELLASGRDASLRGDVQVADDDLTAALACWHGEAFADIRGLAAAQGAIARLDELRATTIEELVDVRLVLGRPASVIELLVDAVDEFRLRERLAAQLMLALYRCGRQADALRVCAALAQRLDEQLGLAPCAEVRQLEEDILLQRRHLDLASRSSPAVVVAGTGPQRTRLIGRREELARLLALHDEAHAGNRRVAFVSGPTGIGKASLVRAYRERAERAGATVLVGRGAAAPRRGYDAIIEALAGAAAADADTRDDVVDVLGVLRGDGASERADAADADGRRSDVLRLYESIATMLASLPSTLVVLVIEDLHWVDRSTMRVLRHLLRDPRLDHLFLVATYCDEELDSDIARRIGRLAPPMFVTHIALGGFDVHEVRALIRSTVTSPDLPMLLDLATSLQETTDGNPLHVRALLAELEEARAAGADRDALEAALMTLAPNGLRVLVGRRVERLSVNAQRVLDAAAVLGGTITASLLVETCDLSEGALREAIEELLDSRFLDEHGWHVDHYTFPHASIRNAEYHAIPDAERGALHLRVAEVLESGAARGRPRNGAEIAHHYLAAGPPADPGVAADHARRAGDEAAQSLSFGEAATWYERALRSWGESGRPDDEMGEIELALGRAYEADRQFAKARAAYVSGAAHARACGNAALFADLALAAGGPWTSGLDDNVDTQALLEAALAAVDDHDRARRLRLLTGLAASLYYVDPEREGRLVDEALELAVVLADPGLSSSAALAQHLWLTHVPEARGKRLSAARKALQFAIESASPGVELRARREHLTDLLENAEIDQFVAGLGTYERLADEHCSPRDIYWSMALHATLATLRGDLVAAEQLARGAQLRGHELQQESSGAELLQRFVIRYQQGRLAEEVGAVRRTGAGRSAYRAGSCLGALACAETGRVVEGVRITRWAIGEDGCAIRRDAFWLGAHALFAGVAATAGDRDLAAQLIDLLAECADHVVVFGAGGAILGCGHHWLGVLETTCGHWDRAVEHLERAEQVSERLDAPYWRAQAQIDLAYALFRRGHRPDAVTAEQLIDSARSTAEKHGYGRLLVRATVAR